jgi:hypothetical protein
MTDDRDWQEEYNKLKINFEHMSLKELKDID